jgi:putative endonuclease
MTYYVYILYSSTFDKYYIGQTDNLIDRVTRHNRGYETFTSKFRPWQVAWHTQKATRSDALALERKLKNLSKARLVDFIIKY